MSLERIPYYTIAYYLMRILLARKRKGNVVAICISKAKYHFWTPASSQTMLPVKMKFDMVYYVREFNKCAEFHNAANRGFAPTRT